MIKENKTRTIVSISKEADDYLRAQARAHNMTVSELVEVQIKWADFFDRYREACITGVLVLK